MTIKRFWLWRLILLVLIINPAIAQDSMVFKQAMPYSLNWLNYGVIIITLLIIIVAIKRKQPVGLTKTSVCQVVEKKYLGHKTTLYIIKYQQQRFLLADNQHALALQPLTQETVDEL